MAQQRLCTEPEVETEEALMFAVVFEESISQQRSFGGQQEWKTEPVCTRNERTNKPCTECAADFTTNHFLEGFWPFCEKNCEGF